MDLKTHEDNRSTAIAGKQRKRSEENKYSVNTSEKPGPVLGVLETSDIPAPWELGLIIILYCTIKGK